MTRKKETKKTYSNGDFVKIAPRFLHLLPALPGRTHAPAIVEKSFGTQKIISTQMEKITAYDVITFLQILQNYYLYPQNWHEDSIKIPIGGSVTEIPVATASLNVTSMLKQRGIKNTALNRTAFLSSIMRWGNITIAMQQEDGKAVFTHALLATVVDLKKPWESNIGVAFHKPFIEACLQRGLVVAGLKRIFSYSGRGATYAVLIDLYLQANSTLRNITEDRICKDLVIQLKNPKKTHEIIRLAFQKIAQAGGQKWRYDRQKKQWIREG